MGKLLDRQLRRYGGGAEAPPPRWGEFLRAVDDVYLALENDRIQLERYLDLMSRELTSRNEELRADIAERTSVEAALRQSEARLRKEIEDRERMEVELRLKQKLESVGQLAAGIAHEINTPVQYIGDSAHFLRTSSTEFRRLFEVYAEGVRALPPTPEVTALRAKLAEADEAADLAYLEEQVPKAFERILDGINRVATIVAAVKDFAHPGLHSKAPADLNRALQSTLIVSRNEYKYVAEIETTWGDVPLVECLLGDMNQVFLNLIVNAAHAIGTENARTERPRGLIRIATRLEGDEVVIDVADNGSGIPEAIRNRIFDPFFTTKEVGRGTGQGLAISRSIVVDRHGGSLTFESEVGVGTTFSVRLPLHPAVAQERAA